MQYQNRSRLWTSLCITTTFCTIRHLFARKLFEHEFLERASTYLCRQCLPAFRDSAITCQAKNMTIADFQMHRLTMLTMSSFRPIKSWWIKICLLHYATLGVRATSTRCYRNTTRSLNSWWKTSHSWCAALSICSNMASSSISFAVSSSNPSMPLTESGFTDDCVLGDRPDRFLRTILMPPLRY